MSFPVERSILPPFPLLRSVNPFYFSEKNVDFHPKQVGEKSQFSLISKDFSGEGVFPFPKTAAFLFCFGQVVLFFSFCPI